MTDSASTSVERVKRAARILSKECGIPHQRMLDGIAAIAGRSHWGSLASVLATPTASDDLFPTSGDPVWDGLEDVRSAMNAGKGLLISGGTASGKVTLLVRLLESAGPESALVLVRDGEADEAAEHSANHPGWRWFDGGEAEKDRRKTLRSLIESRPDAIVLPEISNDVADIALESETPVISVVHANDPYGACRTFVERAARGQEITREQMHERIQSVRRRFCVVQMHRSPDTGRPEIAATLV